MANYIHSTCGQSMVFRITEPKAHVKQAQADKVIKEIRIGGGAWVITADGQRIPRCVDTEVTDEDLELLEANPAFQNIKKRGFFVVNRDEHQVRNTDGTPNDMERKDYGCSQISDNEHAEGSDPRTQENVGLRATYGEKNVYGGKQPITVEESDYGPIRVG